MLVGNCQPQNKICWKGKNLDVDSDLGRRFIINYAVKLRTARKCGCDVIICPHIITFPTLNLKMTNRHICLSRLAILSAKYCRKTAAHVGASGRRRERTEE